MTVHCTVPPPRGRPALVAIERWWLPLGGDERVACCWRAACREARMAEGEAAVGSPGVGIGEELGEDMVMMIGVCQCLRGMKQIIQSIQALYLGRKS